MTMDTRVRIQLENIRLFANRAIEEFHKPQGYSVAEAACDIQDALNQLDRAVIEAR
jgi:hypothetical protein